jgi:hypothetical protein
MKKLLLLALLIPVQSIADGVFTEDANVVLHWVADEWNMIRFPEAFTAGQWPSGTVSATVTDNFAAAPNGTMTAARVVWAAGAPRYVVSAAVVEGSTVHTASMWLKSNTGANQVLRLFSCGALPLVDTTVTTTWQRFSVTCTTTATTGLKQVVGVYSATTNVAADILIWGAQLVRGDRALPYKSPPVANLLASPKAIGTSPWLSSGCAFGNWSALVATQNSVASPDGVVTATKLALGVTGNSSNSVCQVLSATPSAIYKLGVWLKGDGTLSSVQMGFNTGNSGVLVLNNRQTKTCPLTTAWSYCEGIGYTFPASGSNQIEPYIQVDSIQPSGAAFYAWGATLTRADQQGDTLVMNGTVPVSNSTLFPSGYGTGRRGVGPYAAGAPLFNSDIPVATNTAAFTVCVAYYPQRDIANNELLITTGQYNVSGFQLWHRPDPAGYQGVFNTSTAGLITQSMAAIPSMRGLSVLCGGVNGSNQYVKSNSGLTYTTASPKTTPGTLTKIGIDAGVGSGGSTLIYEVYVTNSAWNEATVTALQSAALAQGDPTKPLFTPDANTVLHLKGNDYTGGSVWAGDYGSVTKVGTVGYSDSFVPPIQNRLARQAYGPLSSSNYLSLGAGADVLDFAGDFTVCAVATSPVGLTAPIVGSGNFGASGAGWDMGVTSSSGYINTFATGSTITGTTTNALTVPGGGPTVVCAGRAGSTQYVKANGGTTVSSAGAKTTPDTTTPSYIGKRGDAGGGFFSGQVLEVYATTSAWNETTVSNLQKKALGMILPTGQTLSVTRAGPQTVAVPTATGPAVVTVPAGAPALGPDGIEVYGTRVNSILQSQTIASGTNYIAPWTANLTTVTEIAGGPSGSGSWAEVTSTNVQGGTDAGTVTIPSNAVYTFSIWASKSSGTGYAGLMGMTSNNIAASSCSCGRSDGGACTAQNTGPAGTSYCYFTLPDLGTTPIRMWLTVTGPSAATAPRLLLLPGQYPTAVGTTRFWGAQVEAGVTTPGPYCPTTTGTCTTPATVATVPLPVLGYANLYFQSETPASWSRKFGVVNTDNQILSPVGTMTGGQITEDGTTAVHYTDTTVTTANAPHAYSISLKAGTRTWATINKAGGTAEYCYINLMTGALGSCSPSFTGNVTVTAQPNGWWRVNVTYTPPAGGVFWGVGLASSDGVNSYTGDPSKYIYVWGAQLTATPTVQPYVPTTSAIAYGGNKWCVGVTGQPPAGIWPGSVGGNYLISIGVAGLANSFGLYRAAASGAVWAYLWDSGAVLRNTGTTATMSTGPHRFVAHNSAGTLTLYADGIATTSSAAGTALFSATSATLSMGSGEGEKIISNLKIVNNPKSWRECF